MERPRVKDKILFRREDFGGLAIDVEDGRVHELNKVGVRIFELCDGQNTVKDIIEKLATECNKDPDVIGNSISRFMRNLEDRDLIEWV